MWILDYLEKVREKPVQERKKLLLIWAGTGTLIIACLWLINIFIFAPGADNDYIFGQKERWQQVKGSTIEQSKKIYDGFVYIKDSIVEIF